MTDAIQTIATRHLEMLIACDSQSDETSTTIPSTEGQRVLSDLLQRHFEALGLEATQDKDANLLVRVPARGADADAPALALMAHMDTSKGTQAVPKLERVAAWDGSRVPYPENDRLQVTVEAYPQTKVFLGQELLHGPGLAPVGLDDKLGIAQIMTLVELLQQDPAIPHPELWLCFRPDEEIGRMAAVEGLADALAERGVRYGYTIDGLDPFEVNVENFHAARGTVAIEGWPLARPEGDDGAGAAREVSVRIEGVKSHGATAKAEGYRNATVLVARALEALGADGTIVPVAFETDPTCEVSADATFRLFGEDGAALEAAGAKLRAALDAQLTPHATRGAYWKQTGVAEASAGPISDALSRAFSHLAAFLAAEGGPRPLLSEESDGYEGYTNPYELSGTDARATVRYRIRDFDPEALDARGAHLRTLCEACDPPLDLEIEQQYVNMGPALAPYPELVTWAQSAAEAIGETAPRLPIRGGTGVDPFLDREIPVANLGTGYFAPESEKELTSVEMLARHCRWLCEVVRTVAENALRQTPSTAHVHRSG